MGNNNKQLKFLLRVLIFEINFSTFSQKINISHNIYNFVINFIHLILAKKYTF